MSDVKEWKKALESRDSAKVAEANKWLKRALDELKQGTMPPQPFELQLSLQERKALIEFLEGQNQLMAPKKR